MFDQNSPPYLKNQTKVHTGVLKLLVHLHLNIPINITELALYTDDPIICTTSWRLDTITNRLVEALRVIQKHYNKWKIKLNQNKTEAILITKRSSKMLPRIVTKGRLIKWSENVKYLGVTLDAKLNFNEHIRACC